MDQDRYVRAVQHYIAQRNMIWAVANDVTGKERQLLNDSGLSYWRAAQHMRDAARMWKQGNFDGAAAAEVLAVMAALNAADLYEQYLDD